MEEKLLINLYIAIKHRQLFEQKLYKIRYNSEVGIQKSKDNISLLSNKLTNNT
jgi:hypothetical protein